MGMLARRFGPMRLLLALVALLSGVALLAEINFRIDLRLGLAASFVAGSVVVATAVARATPKQRRWIGRTVAVGATSGLFATLSYDVSRTFLSVLDPSPFNPFE